MIQPLLSQATPVGETVRPTLQDFIPRDLGLLILIGALLVVTLGVFIWAAFFRKSPRRPHYHFRRHRQHHDHAHHDRPHHRRPEQPAKPPEERWNARKFFSFKRHRHRHRQRRRNPTLAEAGGLPPVRSEEQPPTSA